MTDKFDLVARRQNFIQRQVELHKDAVNVRFGGRPPEGSGPPNRHGMPKLPVGQHEVKNWPVLDLGEQPNVPIESWKLEIGGLAAGNYRVAVDGVAMALQIARAGVSQVVELPLGLAATAKVGIERAE